MKTSDLSPDRQKLLVPLKEYPGASALVPPPAPRTLGLKEVFGDVVRAHEELGAMQAATSRLPNPNLATRTLDRREAVRSSQIEGTSSDVDQVLEYEATGSNDGLPRDVVVTFNYVKALHYGLQQVKTRGAAALDRTLIEMLHRHLMEGADYKDAPGQFRQRQNWIGGHRNIYDAKFVPPPHEYLGECIADLEELLRYVPSEEDQTEISIVIRLAIIHAQFETIHPFIDGNGRVGRLLLPLVLFAEGYPPVYLAGFLKENQQEYYDTLSAVQLRGEWVPWVRFFAEGVQVAARETIQTAERLTALLDQWKALIRTSNVRSDALPHRLPEYLIAHPVVTVRSIQEAFNTSFPTANAALNMMREKGIVAPHSERKRDRIFIAADVINVLNRPPVPGQ
ncbi:MAG: Fic family protein [Trichlorobacter sp.]|uniref:Fic family protein n=1 Tax=Trichlorobacter sp. TaxID=2911007 RepID=UPI00256941C5|nr:Fic/DOC family N-terminal domain-containing protein [Trichlorobacter sp.]MDK9718105.1 Fic family protein [Trichlorobacter sp.]